MYKADILRALFDANAITFKQLTGAAPADAEIAAFTAGQAYCHADELMDKEEEIDRLESDLRNMEEERDDAERDAQDLRDALRELIETYGAGTVGCHISPAMQKALLAAKIALGETK